MGHRDTSVVENLLQRYTVDNDRSFTDDVEEGYPGDDEGGVQENSEGKNEGELLHFSNDMS